MTQHTADIETEPVSEGEMDTEETEKTEKTEQVCDNKDPEEISMDEGEAIQEDNTEVPVLETSTTVELLEEDSSKPIENEEVKDVELVSEAEEEEEEELLLSEPDRADDLITEAITPPATTPPPSRPLLSVDEDQDTGNEILDISDPDEGDMLIEDSLAGRTVKPMEVVSSPLSPVRDLTPVSPACQSPALVAIPSSGSENLLSDDQVATEEGTAESQEVTPLSPELITQSDPDSSVQVDPTPSMEAAAPAAVTNQDSIMVTSTSRDSEAVITSDSLPTESISPPSGSPALPVPASVCQPVSSTTVSSDEPPTSQPTNPLPESVSNDGPPIVKPVSLPPSAPQLEVPTSLVLEISAPSTPDNAVTSTSAEQTTALPTSRASSQEPGPSKKRKIPPTEKPFEPGIIWIKPEPVDPDEPQVIPAPVPDQQPGPSSGVSNASRKRRLVEKQVSGLPSAPPNVHVTATQALGSYTYWEFSLFILKLAYNDYLIGA